MVKSVVKHIFDCFFSFSEPPKIRTVEGFSAAFAFVRCEHRLCSQTKRATICATPRCSVLKAGVSHKTYYTPEGEKMSSIGACKNALTNPARYGTVNAQTRNSTIRARLPGQPKNNDGCEIFRMNGKAAEPRVRGLCCSCRKIFCFPAGRRKHKGCPK